MFYCNNSESIGCPVIRRDKNNIIMIIAIIIAAYDNMFIAIILNITNGLSSMQGQGTILHNNCCVRYVHCNKY